MSNLIDVQFNLLFAGLLVLLVAASAATIRLVAGAKDEPLGAAGSVALAAGGLGYALFVSAAAGWIGEGGQWRVAWWVAPAVAWSVLSVAIAFAFDSRFWRNLPSPPEISLRLLPALLFLAWAVSTDLLMCFDPQFHGDAIQYHLTLPVHWIREGGLKSHPSIGTSGYPLLTELLYAIPVTHGLPFATRIVHLAFGTAVVLTIYGYLRGRLSAAGALAFGTAFFAFDSVNEVAAWANTDLARTFFLVGAAALLAQYAEKRQPRSLVIGSIVAGLAMSTHYMCIVFGNGLLTIALIVDGVSAKRKRRELLRDLGVFWAVSLAVFSPWPIKNIIQHGWPLVGVQNTSFRVPSFDALNRLFGFGIAAVWLLARRRADRDVAFLSVYLLLYLVVGAFEMPPIMRFFFPVHAVGLMLAGRLAAPLLDREWWIELAIPLVLLAVSMGIAFQSGRHLYADAARFVFEGSPPARAVIWHR